jgi:hypothetical protein
MHVYRPTYMCASLSLVCALQVVVICGRNARLLGRLSTATPPGGMPVKACGFVNNIHEWMGACDCIITKVRCFAYGHTHGRACATSVQGVVRPLWMVVCCSILFFATGLSVCVCFTALTPVRSLRLSVLCDTCVLPSTFLMPA